MGDMPPVTLPYLQIYRSRGKAFAYYRRDGRQVRIKALPADQGFAAAYEAARLAWEAAPAATPLVNAEPGSINALVIAYRASPEFRRMATKTQADYGRTLDMLRARFGTGEVAKADKAWVYRLRDELQDKPRSANYRVAIIGALMTFAMRRGLRTDSPTAKVERLATGPGHRCWTPGELAAMTDKAAGDVALPVMIGRYIAQREGDVLRLLWSAYDGSSITLRQGKTGTHLVVPVPAELRQALDAIHPRPGALICLTAQGRAWKPDWFRHRFAQVRAAAGLDASLHFHGLRHTRLTELAEGGATEAEIMANSGHKSASMVQTYTRAARQKGLAESGVARLADRKKNAPGV